MKKLIAILCAIVLAMSLAGCGVHDRITVTSWTEGEDTVTESVLIDGELIEVASYDAAEYFARNGGL